MKTLFIASSYLAGNGGGIYASKAYINSFAEISEEMTLLYPYKEGKYPEGINEDKIKMIRFTDERSDIRKFVELIFGKVHRFDDIDKTYFNASNYDVVVFDNSVVSSQLIKKFKNAGVKAITIHHNYQIEYLKGDSSKLTRLPALFWTSIYEKEAVKYSDINFVLTKQDKEMLKKHYCKDANFVVIGVFEYQKDSQIVKTDMKSVVGHRFIITGGLGDKQTERTLIPWIKEYYPLLREFIKDSSLTIAGSNPSDYLTKICNEYGAKLIASPSDMIPILQEADYYVCPISLGSGLKLRIMDGLKMGLPVITHIVSARGYETIQEQGIVFSYDNKESFVDSLFKLIDCKLTREQVQKAYQRQFAFEAGVEKIKNACVELL